VADLITRLIGAIGTQRCGTNPEIIIIHNFREEKNMKQVLIRISPPVPLQGILSGGEVMRFINQAFS